MSMVSCSSLVNAVIVLDRRSPRSGAHSKQKSSRQRQRRSNIHIKVAHSIPYTRNPEAVSSFGDIHFLWPPHIITVPPRDAGRFLDVVNVRATTASSSATARRTSDGRTVANVRLAPAAPGTWQSAHTPQPQDQQGTGNRADDDSGNRTSGNRTGASGRGTSHDGGIDGCL